jgi:hypothetical protein
VTAAIILTLCASRGVRLVADGARIVLKGPQAARDELRPLIAAHKLELLAVLRSPATATDTTSTTTAEPCGVICDDCGRPTRIALVTSYGARYCRECVFPSMPRNSEPLAKWRRESRLPWGGIGEPSAKPEGKAP